MPGSGIELNEINAAAAALELKVVPFEMHRAEDIAAAFEAFDGRVEAVYVVGDAFASANRVRVEPQDRKALRSRNPGDGAATRRRGDRIAEKVSAQEWRFR
jgi:hypothetical protein